MKSLKMLRSILLLALCTVILTNCTQKNSTNNIKEMERIPYGEINGKSVEQFILHNQNGMKVKIINYGAIISHILIPEQDTLVDVVLGFDDLDSYETKNNSYFGAIVGRYGNRIAKGQFSIGDEIFSLVKNNGENHLHGGTKGFDKVVWNVIEARENMVKLSYHSKNMEEGYPGNLTSLVTYKLNDKNQITIEYYIITDKDTHQNLTNHTYFNLAGVGNGDILKHELQLFCDSITPVDASLIPTGSFMPVAGTAFDFKQKKSIGQDIDDLSNQQIQFGGGYDHNFVGQINATQPYKIAFVSEPKSGRTLSVYTTEPGVQLYTGNFLDGASGKNGKPYNKRSAFCLETQHFPDSPNQNNFPSTLLKPGKAYTSKTIFEFGF